MKRGALFDTQLSVHQSADRAAANSETGLAVKAIETFLEVIRFKGQISIEFNEELPLAILNRGIAFIESFDNAAARFAEAAV